MTTPDAQPVHVQTLATVSILDVFAKVVEMQTTLAVISKQLEQLPDHEQRIRKVENEMPDNASHRLSALETSKARLAGVCVALGTIAGGGAGWVALLIAHAH